MIIKSIAKPEEILELEDAKKKDTLKPTKTNGRKIKSK